MVPKSDHRGDVGFEKLTGEAAVVAQQSGVRLGHVARGHQSRPVQGEVEVVHTHLSDFFHLHREEETDETQLWTSYVGSHPQAHVWKNNTTLFVQKYKTGTKHYSVDSVRPNLLSNSGVVGTVCASSQRRHAEAVHLHQSSAVGDVPQVNAGVSKLAGRGLHLGHEGRKTHLV